MATGVVVAPRWRWFREARFGLFILWGAYAVYGRGEQVRFREFRDQRASGEPAGRWRPGR